VSLGKWFLTFRKIVLNQTIALRSKRVKISRCYSRLKETTKNVWNDSESPCREFVWTSRIRSRIVNYAKPTLVVEGVGMPDGNYVTVTW